MSNLSGFVKRLRDIMRNDAGINGDAQRIEQIAWMLFLKVYDAKEQDWEWDDEEYVSIIPEECRWQNWAVDDHTGTALTLSLIHIFVLARYQLGQLIQNHRQFTATSFVSGVMLVSVKR